MPEVQVHVEQLQIYGLEHTVQSVLGFETQVCMEQPGLWVRACVQLGMGNNNLGPRAAQQQLLMWKVQQHLCP